MTRQSSPNQTQQKCSDQHCTNWETENIPNYLLVWVVHSGSDNIWKMRDIEIPNKAMLFNAVYPFRREVDGVMSIGNRRYMALSASSIAFWS